MPEPPSAAAHAAPETRLTARSAEGPPRRTAMFMRTPPPARSPIRGSPPHAPARAHGPLRPIPRYPPTSPRPCSAGNCSASRSPARRPAAAPGTRPRRSAAHALPPIGFLNVDPPVRERSGWIASRAAAIRSISALIAAGSPGRPRKTAPITIAPPGSALNDGSCSRIRPHAKPRHRSITQHHRRLDEHVRHLAPIRARVHRHRAAERARDAAQKLQSLQPPRRALRSRP